MGQKQEALHFNVGNKEQNTARVLARYRAGRRDRQVARTIFVNTIPNELGTALGSPEQTRKLAARLQPDRLAPSDQQRFAAIEEAVADDTAETLASRQTDYSKWERAGLVWATKKRKGLNKDTMLTEAGYSEREIAGITKKGAAKTIGADTVLTSISYLLGGLAIFKDSIVNSIPNSTTALLATGAAYVGSFLLLTRQNLGLTEEQGASFNVWATGMYAAANRLFSEKIRNRIAQIVPVITDTLQRSAILGTVAGFTGDAHKIIAANATNAVLNFGYAIGIDAFRRKKKGETSDNQQNGGNSKNV
jgi:hypothetical protein